MAGLGRTIADLTRYGRLMEAAGRSWNAGTSPSDGRLVEIADFGANPGNLRMLAYVPASAGPRPALVVVLHGCTQTAEGYDRGTGWSRLAEEHGFVLLFPEQRRANNPKTCFTWFEPGDTQRDAGEAASIRQMVAHMVGRHEVDEARIFVTGLSAGGAMTSVMLATYPEVFAAGAIIAGLPYGAASNVSEAFQSMFKGERRSARQWGALVRAASPHRGPWPRVSVWHGSADTTVVPQNADETVKQWADLHGVAVGRAERSSEGRATRAVWRDRAGVVVIESVTIPGLAHGTPLATTGAETCGEAGPFLLEAGISSTHHIARFFGLLEARPAARREAPRRQEPVEREEPARRRELAVQGTVTDHDETARRGERPRQDLPRRPARAPSGAVDIEAVINGALRAAGLIKS